jgi:hypothetical protein
MEKIAKQLKYHTSIERPPPSHDEIFAHYFPQHKSPRQIDMLKYYTSTEQPSVIETIQKSLNISK